MAIVAGDIDIQLSGGGANSVPDASLGGGISSVSVIDATLHNLFDVVGSAEASAGDTEYRCVYVKNTHGTLTLENAVVWIQSQTTSVDTSVEIAVDTVGVNGQASTVANETTAPGGQAFSAPSSEGGALSIGDIPPGEHQAVWVKRIVSAAASAANNDTMTIRVKGDTQA